MLQHDSQIDKGKDGGQESADQHASYVIDGKHFDVERVFNDSANDSLGTVLLRLINAEIAPF